MQVVRWQWVLLRPGGRGAAGVFAVDEGQGAGVVPWSLAGAQRLRAAGGRQLLGGARAVCVRLGVCVSGTAGASGWVQWW